MSIEYKGAKTFFKDRPEGTQAFIIRVTNEDNTLIATTLELRLTPPAGMTNSWPVEVPVNEKLYLPIEWLHPPSGSYRSTYIYHDKTGGTLGKEQEITLLTERDKRLPI